MTGFLIKAIEIKSLEAFKLIIENYEKSFARDPSFKTVGGLLFFFFFLLLLLLLLKNKSY